MSSSESMADRTLRNALGKINADSQTLMGPDIAGMAALYHESGREASDFRLFVHRLLIDKMSRFELVRFSEPDCGLDDLLIDFLPSFVHSDQRSWVLS